MDERLADEVLEDEVDDTFLAAYIVKWLRKLARALRQAKLTHAEGWRNIEDLPPPEDHPRRGRPQSLWDQAERITMDVQTYQTEHRCSLRTARKRIAGRESLHPDYVRQLEWHFVRMWAEDAAVFGWTEDDVFAGGKSEFY